MAVCVSRELHLLEYVQALLADVLHACGKEGNEKRRAVVRMRVEFG